LHTRLSNDDIEKFQKEAQTIANLRHPSIVRILDFDVEDNIPFLVMDHAPNGTLRERHPKGTRLPLHIIVSYVKRVADALQYAHDQRLVHRDVKPENMLLGPNNEVLLSDFGIAVVAHSTLSQTPQMALHTIWHRSRFKVLLARLATNTPWGRWSTNGFAGCIHSMALRL